MTPTRHITLHALVLQGTDVGETSRLVTLMTAERGRVSVRARGLRQRGSKHAAVLEPFNLIEARAILREGADVGTFVEGSVLVGNAPIRSDVRRAAAAGVWAELLGTIECDPSDAPALLRWMRGALEALADAPQPVGLGALGAWQLLTLVGIQPQLDRCLDTGEPPEGITHFHLLQGGLVAQGAEDPMVVRLSADQLALLRRVPETPPARLARIRLTSAQARGLAALFDQFCQVQLDINLRSLRFLRSLEVPNG